jgi:glycosyltransferase involved in cell wall biosynthesis
MHVLWVKAGKLLPVDTGGKIRSYNLLRHLAARHRVVLLSHYGGEKDPRYEREIRDHFPAAEVMWTDTPLASKRHYLQHVLSPVPYAVAKFTSPPVRRVVSEWLGQRRFDVAVCDFLSTSLNFPDTSPTPCVLFQHNVESVLWRRQARYEPNVVKRLAFTLEAAKMARYEAAAVARFDHVIAVAERDREAMRAMIDPRRISVVPTGVDVQQYRVAAARPADRQVVTFLGSMDWEANVDAVEYFCRAIWPTVQAAVPSAQFRIVGRNPTPRILELASPTILVTGTVPRVLEHLQETAVFVVPLRVGGGTRLKIFEAMAAGRAVVSTSIGAEGLDVADGRDIILADTATSFANAVVRLLTDTGVRNRLGRAAAESAGRHDWSAIAKRMEAILQQAADVAAPASRRAAAVGA